MRPSLLYRLGMRLAVDAREEALQRTVINRVYYGLHHEMCCRYFRQFPLERPLGQRRRHTELTERLNDPTNPVSAELANLLHELLELRTEADYQLVPPMRFRRRSYHAEQMMELAMSRGERLWEKMEAQFPGEASEDCECKTAYISR